MAKKKKGSSGRKHVLPKRAMKNVRGGFASATLAGGAFNTLGGATSVTLGGASFDTVTGGTSFTGLEVKKR